MNRGLTRAALLGVGSLFLVWLGLHSAAHSRATAALLGLPDYPGADRCFWAGIVLAFVAGAFLTCHLLLVLWRCCRRAPWFGRPDRAEAGTIMVEFCLVFPFLGLAMGLTVQAALIAQATLVVQYSAYSAARAAIVRTEYSSAISLWEDLYKKDEIERVAELALASISPEAGGGGSSADAAAIRQVFQNQNGPWGSNAYPARVAYASWGNGSAASNQTTRVNLTTQPAALLPDIEDLVPPLAFLTVQNLGGSIPTMPSSINNFLGNFTQFFAPLTVTAEVEFELLCVIPGLPAWIGITQPAKAGVGGTVFTIRQSCRLQSTGGRESSALALLPIAGNSFIP